MLYPLDIKAVYKLLSSVEKIERIDSDTVSKHLNVSKKRADKLLPTIEWIRKKIGGKHKTFPEFKNKLLDALNREFQVKQVINELWINRIPYNPYSICYVLSKKGLKVDLNTCKFIEKVLTEIKVIGLRKIPTWLGGEEDRILEFILNKGYTNVSTIIRHFGDVREILLNLCKEDKIEIIGIEDIGLDIKKINDFDHLDIDKINVESSFIKLYRDSKSGKLLGKIILPKHASVKAKW